MLTNKMSLKHFKRSDIANAVTAALLFSTSNIIAAEAEDDAEAKPANNVITVTANRREENIQEVPFNISAISGDTLAEAQITDASELMRGIAGVAVVDRGQRNAGVINGIMIRGLNVDGSALGDYALSTVPTVSTYVNDTPVYANFILKDIDRVEVLRGPQGTLYGSGSLGGTVKYILNQPVLGEFEGSVTTGISQTTGAGDFSSYADVIVNVPVSDNSAFRFVAGTADYAGITDYVNVYQLDENRLPLLPDGGIFATDPVFEEVKDADEVDLKYYRISYLFEPNDTFSAVVSHQRQEDYVGGRRQQTTGNNGFGEAYDDLENGSVLLEPSNRDVELSSLEMDFDLGFATLTSSTSMYQHSGDSISENTGFYAQAGFLSFYYFYPRPMAEAVRTYSDEATIQELRLVSNGDSDFDYVVGVFYKDQDLTATQDSYLRGFTRWADAAFGFSVTNGDRDFYYRRAENFKEMSIFGEITYDFTDDFRMTFGLRNYDTEATNDTILGNGLYTSIAFEVTESFPRDEDGTLFKANFANDLADNMMLYGTLSEGYRRGGSNAIPTEGNFAEDPGYLEYAPDQVTNYEFGIKGSRSMMNYNISLFRVDWDNIQQNVATPNFGFFTAVNGGEAQTSGLEVELNGYLDDSWQYSIGYAHVDAELKEDILTPTGFVIADAGNALPGTPEDSLSLALINTLEFDHGAYLFSRFSVYYQSSSENVVSNSDIFRQTMPSFNIVDLSSTYALGAWNTTLWVKNLFNEEASTGVFKEQYMGTAPEQNYFGNGSKEFIALPRTVGLTLTYSY